MLSFDVTDRKIRIIKGTESGGKIKISAAAEIALEEAVIVNGHVNDINRVAVLINQVLKRNNMPDKEAIVAISSNQTVFKELLITPIRHQLEVQINVDDSYSVAYVIVGEPEDDENGEKKQKVLVTACPYDVVDCYKRIFHMLSINLRSVMIGCNAITKVLMADSKTKAKMPLLAVQIDSDFISLNLYENNQLSFSRFASIDPEDYENPDDYVFEAVNENIFRMLQFARSRGSDTIENVVFYGDINVSPNLYNRLIDELASNELNVSQLNVPPQIHGYQNLEFSVYANSIGAMFKRDKLTEHINLLETESSAGAPQRAGTTDKSFTVFAAVALIASIVCVGGVWGVLAGMTASKVNETEKLQADIDSPETSKKLKQYDDLGVMRDTVSAYADTVKTAKEAYLSQPILTEEYYLAIDDALENAIPAAEGAEGEDTVAVAGIRLIQNVDYENGVFTFPVNVATNDVYSQKYPAAMVEYLYKNYGDLFSKVEYTGYAVQELSIDEAPEEVNGAVQEILGGVNEVAFDLVLTVNNEKQLPEIEAPTEAPSEEAPAEEAPAEDAAAE